MRYTTNLNWLDGFLNHQQYQCFVMDSEIPWPIGCSTKNEMFFMTCTWKTMQNMRLSGIFVELFFSLATWKIFRPYLGMCFFLRSVWGFHVQLLLGKRCMSRESIYIYIYNVALKQKENSEARGPTLEWFECKGSSSKSSWSPRDLSNRHHAAPNAWKSRHKQRRLMIQVH